MIKLYQFAPAFGLPNASPFCMKVETYLRMAGLPHELVNDGLRVMKAPKGKLPFIDDDGVVVADSTFIIEHLQRRYGAPLDEALGALLDLQNESGAFAYMLSVPDDNQFATAQAIPAVSGVAFPLPVKLAVLATPEATPAG